MREFKVVNKIFVRSSNETFKMLRRYTISLSILILSLLIFHLYKGQYPYMINLVKTIVITSVISIVFQYLINLNRHKSLIHLIFKEDNILASAFIIALFTYKEELMVIIVATVITEVSRLINRDINISSCLYGILFVIIYQQFYNGIETPLINFSNLQYYATYQEIVETYGSIKSYLLGTNLYYLSPILSIISFAYLFYKKSIKYSLVVSYLTTFIIGMLFYGLINGMNIWFLIFQIVTGNIIFLAVFALSDYKLTPVTQEGQTIYGIIIGIFTIILRFVIPELSVVISLILGPILLTRYIDKISYKLKYHQRFYQVLYMLCIGLLVLTILIISFIY